MTRERERLLFCPKCTLPRRGTGSERHQHENCPKSSKRENLRLIVLFFPRFPCLSIAECFLSPLSTHNPNTYPPFWYQSSRVCRGGEQREVRDLLFWFRSFCVSFPITLEQIFFFFFDETKKIYGFLKKEGGFLHQGSDSLMMPKKRLLKAKKKKRRCKKRDEVIDDLKNSLPVVECARFTSLCNNFNQTGQKRKEKKKKREENNDKGISPLFKKCATKSR